MRSLILLLFLFQIVHCSCPDDFELAAGGQCALLKPVTIDIPANQATSTAISNCKSMNAQPVIIQNDDQQSYWTGKFNNRLALGLKCDVSTTKWLWADGSALDYKPPPPPGCSMGYKSDLDDNCKSGSAVYIMNATGYWNDWDSTGTYTFDIYCTTQLQQPVSSGDGCESFEDDNEDGVCYQVGATAESWTDAQNVCWNLGANLASIHNAQENSFVRRLAVSRGVVDGIYLGATSSGKGNNYGWIDGSEWDYQNFYAGFPVKGLGDCVVMDTQSVSGEWVNTDCSSNFSVACIRQPMEPACSVQTWKEGQLIVSPGFPYNASIPCDFMLMVDAGKRVEVEIQMLEANSCCDNLVLFENSIGKNIIANLTGSIENQKYKTTSSNFMRVSWQPNGGVNVRGVVFTFHAV